MELKLLRISRLLKLSRMTRINFISDVERYFAIVLVLAAACTLAHAQSTPGFLSIDCGYNGTIAYVDRVTKFSWVNDGEYTLTGTDAEFDDFTVDSTLDNSQALQSFRYFPEIRSKHCYTMPNVYNGSTFLVRAMFLRANSSLLPLPITFSVSVGATNWFTVQYNLRDSADVLNSPKVFESVFSSSEDFIHVCLLPVQGVPFISSLELRTLDTDKDLEHFLWPVLRLNAGAKPGSRTVRFPSDSSDRLWHPPDSAESSIPSLRLPSSDNNTFSDAWRNDTANSSFSTTPYSVYYDGFDDRNVTGAFCIFQLLEISPKANSSTTRVFDIGVNGGYVSFNLTPNVYWFYNVGPMTLGDTLNFDFSAQPSSTLGPSVNAIEVYAQVIFANSTTRNTDVVALRGLQENFNLTDWQGDPCFPVPWDWVRCTSYPSDFSATVSKISLPSQGIKGTIPSSISQLDALTEIHLDNNSLSGPIPGSLADLQFLRVLSLNNNNLSGEVPADLQNKTGLDFTFYGNILLDGGISPTFAPEGDDGTAAALGGIVGSIFFVLVFLGLFIWWWFFRHRKPTKVQTSSPETSTIIKFADQPNQAAGQISLETVKIATNEYARKIGMGSYGSVYYGILDGKEVAVKVNNILSDQKNDEFINEVDILTRVHHKNLVNLIGYCNEGEHLILIYEYQYSGTLREWLKGGDKFLDWPKRLQIAVNAAKGLEYLHKDCSPTIIHRDVKSSNILLDNYLVGKVADFGISKIAIEKSQHLSYGFITDVKGTFGYLDPEYIETSILTQKSDVYSFGVVLAELVSGRPPLSTMSGDGSHRNHVLTDLKNFVERADLEAIADARLEGNYDVESMWRVVDITLACVRRDSQERPDMTEVARNLEMIQARARERLLGDSGDHAHQLHLL